MYKTHVVKKLQILFLAAVFISAGLFVMPKPAYAQSASDLEGCSFEYTKEDEFNQPTDRLFIIVTQGCNQLPNEGTRFEYRPNATRFVSGFDIITIPDCDQAGDACSNLTDSLYSTTAGGGNGNGIRINIGQPAVATQFFGVVENNPNPDPTIPTVEEEPDEPDPSETNADATCESEGGGLSWILCPVLFLADGAISNLDSAINNVLEVPNRYFQDNPAVPNEPADKLEATWARIRNIAYLILVPIIMVMVISTALGFDFISAYSVKKALPRLIAAVLFIALSWEITKFLVVLTNDVGSGVSGLISSSFGGASNITLASILSPDGLDSAGTFVGLVVGGLAIIASTTIGIIISYAMVTLLAMLIAFIVLSFRQMLIIALMLLAPLAILAWIFEGNDKLWKLWWGTFSKLLLMFPLIMALIAAGKAFASIVSDLDGSIFSTFIKVAAYIAPYFFIPATFKFAGGMFATISGMANDRSKGFFDTQRKKRQETRAATRERASANNRFNPQRGIVRKLRLNEFAGWAASPIDNAAYYGRKRIPGLSGRGERIKSAIEGKASEQTGKLFEELNNTFKFNDKAYRALSGSHDAFKGKNITTGESTKDALVKAGLFGKAPATVQEFHKMADILSQSNDATEQVAANVLRGASGRLASLYSDPEMGKANVQAAGMIGLAAHGFASGSDLAYVGNDLIKKGYSSDLAQSFVSSAQVAGQRQRPDLKAGYGTIFENGTFIDGVGVDPVTKKVGKRARDLIKTLSSADLAQAKSHSLKALTPAIEDVLSEGGGEVAARVKAGQGSDTDSKLYGEAQAVKDQLFQWAGPYSQASVDVKRQAFEIIRDNGLQAEFERNSRFNMTPEQLEQMRAAGIEPEDTGGGAPGNA